MAPPGQTTRMASRPEDQTSSEAARQGLLQAQAAKMQETLPVGPEGTMPPSAKGSLLLAIQQRAQDALRQRMMGQEQQLASQQAPQGGMPPPGPPPMQQQPPAMQQQPNMMDQQNRWQEIIKRLQQAQQGVMGQQPQAPMAGGM